MANVSTDLPFNRVRGWLPALSVLILVSISATSRASLAPPDAMVPQRAIEALTTDLTNGRVVDAVERVEGILTEDPTRLIKADDRVLPLIAWVDEQLISTNSRARFAEQYEKVVGPTAQRVLAEAVRAEDVSAIMVMRDRYPWTQAAVAAPLEAGKLLARFGDVRGAKSLLAKLPPATLDATGRQILTLPDDSTPSTASFSADWYENPPAGLPLRLAPVGSRDMVFVASSLSVVALNGQGRSVWSTGAPPVLKPLIAATEKRPGANVVDQSIGQPAVWADLGGAPRIVAARFTTESISSVRAFKAGNGELLWDTATADDTKNMRAIGNPLIVGAYTYQAMLEFDAASAKMYLVALDTVSGRMAWRTLIGDSPSEPSKLRPREDQVAFKNASSGLPAVIDQILFSSAQLAADDASLYVLSGGGWCVRMDRFSGVVRWYSPYPKLEDKQREKDRRQKNAPVFRRWRDRAVADGSTVVIAPTDSDSLIALDVASGKQKWKTDNHRGDDLLGLIDQRVILAGASVTALRADTGDVAWQNAISDAKLTGPGFIDREFVGIVTDRGPVYFSVDQGLVVSRKETGIFNFDAVLRQPTARTQLQTAGMLPAFKTEGASEKPDKPEKPDRRRPSKPDSQK